MTFKSQSGICLTHALTIVNYLHTSLACILNYDLYMLPAGVYCILNQFLYDGAGALYNFSCCYLIGDSIR